MHREFDAPRAQILVQKHGFARVDRHGDERVLHLVQ